jgi:hypothetical protein
MGRVFEDITLMRARDVWDAREAGKSIDSLRDDYLRTLFRAQILYSVFFISAKLQITFN